VASVAKGAGLATLGDEHAADGVEVACLARAVIADGREKGYWGDYVPDSLLPTGLEVDAFELARAFPHCLGQERLAAGGDRRDSRGEVHGCSEPVAGARDGRAMVHADPDSGESVAGDDVVRGREAQRHSVGQGRRGGPSRRRRSS
jgi:hypothetical protein